MKIDWPATQAQLHVERDGVDGPVTYAALLVRTAGASSRFVPDLAAALARYLPAYGIDASIDRMAGFLGQCAHESRGFSALHEIGGPLYFKRMYDPLGANPARAARLGNTEPGDGARYCGRGLIQITGRDNYRRYGHTLGIDLVEQPELAERPAIAVQTALAYWQTCKLNAFCDAGDIRGMTVAINGGLNGLSSRAAFIERARAVLR